LSKYIIERTNVKMIFLFCGKSGSGKDTMLRMLTNTQIGGNSFLPVVSYTTRPKRENETDGIDYHFISKDEFMSRTENATKDNIGSIFEFRKYNTLMNNKPDVWFYGSPVVDIDGTNTHYAAVVDIEGVKSHINFYGKNNCCVIMMAVNDDIRKQRAIERGSFDETEWNRRLKDDAVKFSDENTKNVVDYFVNNNDDEDSAYNKVYDIIADVINKHVSNVCVNAYGVDNLLDCICPERITPTRIRELIAKIPCLDIELRINNALDSLGYGDLLIAVAENASVKKYICKNAPSRKFEENCINALIAFAINSIDNISMQVLYNDAVDKFMLITATDLPWRLTDDDIDASPSHIEHIISKWMSLLTDRIVNVNGKEFSFEIRY
jgi:guanylate kinase